MLDPCALVELRDLLSRLSPADPRQVHLEVLRRAEVLLAGLGGPVVDELAASEAVGQLFDLISLRVMAEYVEVVEAGPLGPDVRALLFSSGAGRGSHRLSGFSAMMGWSRHTPPWFPLSGVLSALEVLSEAEREVLLSVAPGFPGPLEELLGSVRVLVS